ncbi:MAG: hypothetical protein AAF490_19480 [Chloroflexota bacterium]
MNRKVLYIMAGLALLIVVGAGAFTAVQLLSAQNGTQDLPAGAMVFEDVTDDGSGPVTVRTIILPSEDLPNRPAVTGGVLVREEDNSYFVGTGSISVSVNVVNGETSTSVEHSGPEIEVVANRDTQFYRDITEVEFTASESKEQTLEQEITAVSQPELMPEGANIQVWGEQRGDRVIAEIIVFSEPQ